MKSRGRYRGILGCAVIATVGILLLHALILFSNVYYSGDDIQVLYPVAVHSLAASLWPVIRPLQYLILVAANQVYLPLWLGVSLLCVVGATVLSGLACERLLERQLPKIGWWVLGLANPILFYLVSQPDNVSQALCNVLFAAAMLAFISELHRLSGRPSSGWRNDYLSISLNLIAAAMFFTKETAVAPAIVLPAATALMHVRARQFSPMFLFSLLIPIVAASGWIFLDLKFAASGLSSTPPSTESLAALLEPGRYSLKLNPLMWAEHFASTLAFAVTPLPSSFIAFEFLRPLWVMAGLGSLVLFLWLVLCETLLRPIIAIPLIVVCASLAPEILIHSSEVYSTMIAPFAVSIVLLIGFSKIRRLTLAYGVMLYAASLWNGIIYSLDSGESLFGLQRLDYSIYTKRDQIYPLCPIATTAHVTWDGTAAGESPLLPGVKGRITCIR
jgi:hypothetical protein